MASLAVRRLRRAVVRILFAKGSSGDCCPEEVVLASESDDVYSFNRSLPFP